MYSSVFLLTLATSRRTASPLRRPSPVSTTSVARLPTTMPTLGTIPTLKSGIAYVCGPSFTVAPSRIRGSGAGPRCPNAGAASKQARNAVPKAVDSPRPGLETGDRRLETMSALPHECKWHERQRLAATEQTPRRGGGGDGSRGAATQNLAQNASDARPAELVRERFVHSALARVHHYLHVIIRVDAGALLRRGDRHVEPAESIDKAALVRLRAGPHAALRHRVNLRGRLLA